MLIPPWAWAAVDVCRFRRVRRGTKGLSDRKGSGASPLQAVLQSAIGREVGCIAYFDVLCNDVTNASRRNIKKIELYSVSLYVGCAARIPSDHMLHASIATGK